MRFFHGIGLLVDDDFADRRDFGQFVSQHVAALFALHEKHAPAAYEVGQFASELFG